MAKLGFTYEMDRCTGCKACQVACKDQHNLPEGVFFRRVDIFEHNGATVRYSGACNHCEAPACLAGCPTGALYTAGDGTVQHHAGKCIGCGACLWNCPYGAPVFSRAKGISQKCDSCAALRSAGEQPACVAACITHCLSFGPVEAEGFSPPFLPPRARTKPALVVLRDAKKGGGRHE